jgi:hypothetical protein
MVIIRRKFRPHTKARVAPRATKDVAIKGSPRNSGDDFSYADLDWESFSESREDYDTATLLGVNSTEEEGPRGIPKLVWIPLATKLKDGSQTIAFKMPVDLANRVIRGEMSEAELSSPTGPILSQSKEVITTPSTTDRMRGIKRGTIVVRTPSSLIDLMDDQVPDLREGLYMDPVSPDYLDQYLSRSNDPAPVSTLTGSPLAGGIPIYAIFEIASLLGGVLSKLDIDLTLSNIIKLLKGVFINGCPFTAIPRLIGKIASGELASWISSHRDVPIEECLRDWIRDVMFDHLNSDSPRHSSEITGDDGASGEARALNPDSEFGGTLTQNGGGDYNYGSIGGSFNQGPDSAPRQSSRYDLSSDSDVACVPIAYWKRLYAMGSAFRKRDAAPRFDNLQLTGAPATDLLLNRVPSIYIRSNGMPVNTSWQYGTFPMAGGLFKKLIKGVKKVAKGVAKGVSKVMDSPLGSVISAIPVVGNVASVAGKVANTITKITNKLDGNNEVDLEDSGTQDQANTTQLAQTTSQSGTAPNLSQSGIIEINKLPTWRSPKLEKFQAPPLSLLANDPLSCPSIRTPLGDIPLEMVGLDSLCRSVEQREALDEMVAINKLSDICREIDARGPALAYRVIYGNWVPLEGQPVIGPKRRAAKMGGLTSYWAPHSRFTKTRRIPFRLAGDPTIDEEKLGQALSGLATMSEWTGDPSLSTPGDNNEFSKTFFQLYSDGDVSTLFSRDPWDVAGLVSYTLDCPMKDRIESRGAPVGAELAAGIVWAMYLVSSSSLSDRRREEIGESMRSAALSGLFKSKGVDQLQDLALSAKWPTSQQLREPKLGKAWTRMVAATIIYIWNDASGASSSNFAQAISSVCFQSIDAVSLMKAIMMERAKAPSEQVANTIASDIESSKMHRQGTKTDAQNDLAAAMSALGLDPEVAEGEGLTQDFSRPTSCFPAPRSWDEGEIGDLWVQAETICRRSMNEDQARLTMRSIGIPSTIISKVLQQYFSTYTGDQESPYRLSLIPLSRQDYLYSKSLANV